VNRKLVIAIDRLHFQHPIRRAVEILQKIFSPSIDRAQGSSDQPGRSLLFGFRRLPPRWVNQGRRFIALSIINRYFRHQWTMVSGQSLVVVDSG
jgi:hypothetical protein